MSTTAFIEADYADSAPPSAALARARLFRLYAPPYRQDDVSARKMRSMPIFGWFFFHQRAAAQAADDDAPHRAVDARRRLSRACFTGFSLEAMPYRRTAWSTSHSRVRGFEDVSPRWPRRP